MQSGPADKAPKAGYPRWWVAGLVLCLLAVIAFLALRDSSTEIEPPRSDGGHSDTGVATREDAAADLLSRLATVLRTGTRQQVRQLAAREDKAAGRTAAAIFNNVRKLGLTDLSFRYVDEDRSRSSIALGEHEWTADVQVTWRIRGFDQELNRMEVSFVFEQTRHGVALVDVGGADGATPLWLLTELAVDQSRQALVMAADPTRLDNFDALANQAVKDVRRVLSDWRGRLVLEVPRTQAQLNQVLGAGSNTYDAIAAVTSTVDGSARPTSPTHIFVNPKVFAGLGNTGSQIVISHEATHVATNAATSSMAMWLLEGFADYVALAHVDLPVSVTASQILGQVRKDGPPDHLPAEKDFDPANAALGATYESAWLACRLIAEEYGERRLISFYDAVDGGTSLDRAFRSILGTEEGAFTREWRAYLQRFAQ